MFKGSDAMSLENLPYIESLPCGTFASKDDVVRENERLRKDAERYRHLRIIGCWLDPNKYAKAGRVLDAAIDADMRSNANVCGLPHGKD